MWLLVGSWLAERGIFLVLCLHSNKKTPNNFLSCMRSFIFSRSYFQRLRYCFHVICPKAPSSESPAGSAWTFSSSPPNCNQSCAASNALFPPVFILRSTWCHTIMWKRRQLTALADFGNMDIHFNLYIYAQAERKHRVFFFRLPDSRKQENAICAKQMLLVWSVKTQYLSVWMEVGQGGSFFPDQVDAKPNNLWPDWKKDNVIVAVYYRTHTHANNFPHPSQIWAQDCPAKLHQ